VPGLFVVYEETISAGVTEADSLPQAEKSDENTTARESILLKKNS